MAVYPDTYGRYYFHIMLWEQGIHYRKNVFVADLWDKLEGIPETSDISFESSVIYLHSGGNRVYLKHDDALPGSVVMAKISTKFSHGCEQIRFYKIDCLRRFLELLPKCNTMEDVWKARYAAEH